MVSCQKYDFCGVFVLSSPNADNRFAESKKYNEANGFRVISVKDNEYQVYVAADAHITDSNRAMTAFTSEYLSDLSAAPFALFLGDQVDGEGNMEKFASAVAPIEISGHSLFCALGNHDIYFSQWDEYVKRYHTASYLFEVLTPSEGRDLYICLDSASGTLGSGQKEWVESVLTSAQGKYRRIIVLTHTHFFKRDSSQGFTGNFTLEEGYALEKLFMDYGVDMVLAGHDHYFEETRFKNVLYLTLSAIAEKEEPKYYVIKIGSDHISWTEHNCPIDK